MTTLSIGICIPTLNPGRWMDRLVAGLAALAPVPDAILVVDSSSTDDSVRRLESVGARIVEIPRERFDHGGTRNLALDLLDADVVVYLTQDAIPTRADSVAALVAPFSDPRVGMAYGRQLARPDAKAATQVHRGLLYRDESAEVSPADIPTLGVRASFSSNSFAAYRREALESIGRFPHPIISHEDRWAAGMLLRNGWHLRYVAEAVVEHSHEYTARQTINRYFDAGVFEATNPWHEQVFGRPHGLGRQLATAQLKAARRDGVREQAAVITRSAAALLGHQLGMRHRQLPVRMRRRLTQAPNYFAGDNAGYNP
jgi:rhamnosyltransferase